jgi:hypothetical protein|tara:strand:+ start:67 stop:471 length:405 start_codon:yes stop_codon:yes gene_type:complete
MKDEYVSAFYDVVQETRKHTGIELPETVEHYVVILLASHMDKSDFLPNTSFAQTFLQMTRTSDAKTLGDTCLFVTGIFPDYGIDIKYYSDIGKTSYDAVSHNLNPELFSTLSQHFDYVREFINYIPNKRDKYFV